MRDISISLKCPAQAKLSWEGFGFLVWMGLARRRGTQYCRADGAGGVGTHVSRLWEGTGGFRPDTHEVRVSMWSVVELRWRWMC